MFEEQGKFILPWNPIVAEIKHDQRIIISMLQPEPYVYKITKVKNTSPKGICTFIVKQDKYEPDHDYVSYLDPRADDYGDMYADYYSSDVIPEDTIINNRHKIVIESPTNTIKLGTSKILTAKVYDAENNDVTDMYIESECYWDISLVDSSDEDVLIKEKEYLDGNKFKCKFKFCGDEKYLKNNIQVTCKIENMSANVLLDIESL